MKQFYKILIFNLLCLVFGSISAQAQVTLRGKVLDAETGETLIGAALALVAEGGGGTISDYDGN